jgi:hypothetical protein
MVMHLLTTGLSLQVAGTAIFILLRVDHVQCHVTPPHYPLRVCVLLLLYVYIYVLLVALLLGFLVSFL